MNTSYYRLESDDGQHKCRVDDDGETITATYMPYSSGNYSYSVTLDDESTVTVTWCKGDESGMIELPDGLVFALMDLMPVIHLAHGNLFSPTQVYKHEPAAYIFPKASE